MCVTNLCFCSSLNAVALAIKSWSPNIKGRVREGGRVTTNTALLWHHVVRELAKRGRTASVNTQHSPGTRESTATVCSAPYPQQFSDACTWCMNMTDHTRIRGSGSGEESLR